MDRLLNAQKRLAARQAGANGQPRIGTVTSYNPNDGTAKVLIQPEGTQTGWLPVLSQSVGAGWGIHVPLKTGEQVLVLPHEGDAENGIIVGRAFSNAMQPPGSAGSDIVLKSSGGAIINLLTNGNIMVSDASGSTITFSNNGSVTLACNNFTFNGQNFTVNASTNVTIETPVTDISTEVLIGTGPLKVNNIMVTVP
jgi:phage baseplate assembly protein V